jgi:hypothetical protein
MVIYTPPDSPETSFGQRPFATRTVTEWSSSEMQAASMRPDTPPDTFDAGFGDFFEARLAVSGLSGLCQMPCLATSHEVNIDDVLPPCRICIARLSDAPTQDTGNVSHVSRNVFRVLLRRFTCSTPAWQNAPFRTGCIFLLRRCV